MLREDAVLLDISPSHTAHSVTHVPRALFHITERSLLVACASEESISQPRLPLRAYLVIMALLVRELRAVCCRAIAIPLEKTRP